MHLYELWICPSFIWIWKLNGRNTAGITSSSVYVSTVPPSVSFASFHVHCTSSLEVWVTQGCWSHLSRVSLIENVWKVCIMHDGLFLSKYGLLFELWLNSCHVWRCHLCFPLHRPCTPTSSSFLLCPNLQTLIQLISLLIQHWCWSHCARTCWYSPMLFPWIYFDMVLWKGFYFRPYLKML